MIFKNTQLQLLSTCGQLETMRRLWNLSLGLCEWRILRKDKLWFSWGWPDSSLCGSSDSRDIYTTQVLQRTEQMASQEKVHSAERISGPQAGLGSSKCSVTFSVHPTGRYPCLLCLMPKQADFSSENSHDDLVKHLGSRSSAWSNLVSSGLANARTWIPGQGVRIWELTSSLWNFSNQRRRLCIDSP